MPIKHTEIQNLPSQFSRHSRLGVTIIISHAQILDLCSSRVNSYEFMLLFEIIYQVLLIREGINKVTNQQLKCTIAM